MGTDTSLPPFYVCLSCNGAASLYLKQMNLEGPDDKGDELYDANNVVH